MKVPLVGPSGLGRSTDANARRTINLYCEIDDAGGKEKIIWHGMPGTSLFCAAAGTLRGHPVLLGAYAYFVAGTGLYRVDSAGTVSASLGTIPGTGNVSMTTNRYQVVVANGTLGHLYVYDTVASTFSDVTKYSSARVVVTGITVVAGTTYTVAAVAHGMSASDSCEITGITNFNGVYSVNSAATDTFTITVPSTPADETGLTSAYVYTKLVTLDITPVHLTFMDAYVFASNAANTSGQSNQRGYFSMLDDALSWSAADFFTAQRDSDALVRPYAHSGDLLLFGERSLEPWYDSGVGDIPFEPSRAAALPVGLVAPWTVADVEDGVAWVSTRPNGGRAVVLLEGYQVVEISSQAVAYALKQATLAQIQAATAFSYWEEGHNFYQLTFGANTWVFDATASKKAQTPLWYERNGLALSWYCYAFGKHLVADAATARILVLDLDTRTDMGSALTRQAVCGYLHAEDKRFVPNRLFLEMTPLAAGQSIQAEVSTDGGRSWSDLGTVVFVGDYEQDRRPEWFGVPLVGVDLLFRFTTSTTSPVTILGAYVDAEAQAA